MAQDEPLEYAIQLERDGQAFYSEAAARTRNPLGKRMFEALAADERRHEQVLLALAGGSQAELGGEGPKRTLVTLFATLGEEIKAQLDADAGDVEVLGKALEMENASVAHYRRQAEAAPDVGRRALYERLVLEESEHVDILQSTEVYLERSRQWFLWDEQALLDGG